jgi:hemin uptake protein HemP
VEEMDQDPAKRPARVVPFKRRPLRIASGAIFRGRQEVVISHHDTEYRLRITRAGKLLLTN